MAPIWACDFVKLGASGEVTFTTGHSPGEAGKGIANEARNGIFDRLERLAEGEIGKMQGDRAQRVVEIAARQDRAAHGRREDVAELLGRLRNVAHGGVEAGRVGADDDRRIIRLGHFGFRFCRGGPGNDASDVADRHAPATGRKAPTPSAR
jgi:hypothetical protein